MKHRGKKLLSLILTLMLFIGTIPGMTPSAWAMQIFKNFNRQDNNC